MLKTYLTTFFIVTNDNGGPFLICISCTQNSDENVEVLEKHIFCKLMYLPYLSCPLESFTTVMNQNKLKQKRSSISTFKTKILCKSLKVSKT